MWPSRRIISARFLVTRSCGLLATSLVCISTVFPLLRSISPVLLLQAFMEYGTSISCTGNIPKWAQYAPDNSIELSFSNIIVQNTCQVIAYCLVLISYWFVLDAGADISLFTEVPFKIALW